MSFFFQLFFLLIELIFFFLVFVEFIFQVNTRQQCNEDVQITVPVYRYYCISFHCHCFCSNSIKLLMGTLSHLMTQFDGWKSLQIFSLCRRPGHFINEIHYIEMNILQLIPWDERCKINNRKSIIKFSIGKIIISNEKCKPKFLMCRQMYIYVYVDSSYEILKKCLSRLNIEIM